jgi:beta-glucosidase
MYMNQFPKNFTWGAATSSHQVEGHQENDWTEWEKQNAERLAKDAPKRFGSVVPNWDEIKTKATDPKNYISGVAADHYNHYKEDIQILKSLGLNAYRFSLEWSRFQPTEAEWNARAVAHYQNVIAELKANGIEPWITLWHRSLPLWVEHQGGWHNKKTVADFATFVERVVYEYKDSVKFWMPLNEPEFEILGGYLGGNYPPSLRNPFKGYRAFKNLVAAHKEAYIIIHRIQPNAFVGVPHAALAVDPYKNKFFNRLVAKTVTYLGNWKFLNAIKSHTDFIGVQYYTRGVINISLTAKNNYGIPFVEQIEQGLPKSDLGFEIDAKGITPYLHECWKRYRKPIVITENGLPDGKDRYRGQFIKDILTELQKAMESGIDIRGYFHWSLLDNLEWDKGFWPKFGLVEVDRTTQKRTVRESAKVYAEIIKNDIIA